MRAFEEWFNNVMEKRKAKGENIYKCDCEQTWKAALEWAMLESDIVYDNVKERFEDIIYSKIIQQELNND